MSKKMPPLTPQLQAAIDRSRQADAGKARLAGCIAELDRLQGLQHQAVVQMAAALALIEGREIMITGLEADPTTQLLAQVHYQTAGGRVETLVINRTPQAAGPGHGLTQ